jgi:hypothetical protein
MSTDLVISIVTSVIAALSLIGTLIIFNIAKRRENHHNFLERISFYMLPEMLMATQRLREHYRTYGDSNFLDKYIEIMNAENEQMASMPAIDRHDYVLGTLHYQRRLVTHFWRGMSLYIKSDLVPRKAVFNWWTRDDVEIVNKIIIPIENRLAEHLNISILNPKTDLLYYLSSIKENFYI